MNQNKDETRQKLVVHSWRDIKTNPYNQNLHPLMFSPKGLNIRKSSKLKGSTPNGEPVDCLVNYDQKFVVTKLANIFKPLIEADFDPALIIHCCRNAITEAQNNVGHSEREQVQCEAVLPEQGDTRGKHNKVEL